MHLVTHILCLKPLIREPNPLLALVPLSYVNSYRNFVFCKRMKQRALALNLCNNTIKRGKYYGN